MLLLLDGLTSALYLTLQVLMALDSSSSVSVYGGRRRGLCRTINQKIPYPLHFPTQGEVLPSLHLPDPHGFFDSCRLDSAIFLRYRHSLRKSQPGRWMAQQKIQRKVCEWQTDRPWLHKGRQKPEKIAAYWRVGNEWFDIFGREVIHIC